MIVQCKGRRKFVYSFLKTAQWKNTIELHLTNILWISQKLYVSGIT